MILTRMDCQPAPALTAARLDRLRARLAATEDAETALRTLLVLAHEVLRWRESANEAASASQRARASQVPPKRPLPAGYGALVARVHEAVRTTVPAGGRLLIVGKGDDALLVPGYDAQQFPQSSDGGYAGHYPVDSAAAISHLEDCADHRAEYLVFPASSYWWLEFYSGLTSHLLTHGRILFHDSCCLIAQLHAEFEGASI